MPNFKNVGDYTTYLQDMILYGGTDVVNVTNSTSAGAVATMVNVETGLSQNAGYNNVSMLGVDSVLVNCETTRSGADGFNYHANAGKIPPRNRNQLSRNGLRTHVQRSVLNRP